MLTPKERVMRAMRKQEPDKTPFTIYTTQIGTTAVERELRNRGMCILHRRIQSYRLFYKNTDVKEIRWVTEDGREFLKHIYGTPYGEMTTLREKRVGTGFTYWIKEHMFKSEEDYKKLYHLISNTVVIPDYANLANAMKEFGDDVLVYDNLSYEPLQNLIVWEYMDPETFSYEWKDNRDEILKLVDAFTALTREIYKVVVDGPCEVAQFGGNITPEIIGPKLFREYYMPHYYEAAEIFHKKNKLLGSHFDANNEPIMDLITESPLDYVESYDPVMSPGVDVAMEKLKNKTICINWPSGWHNRPLEEIPQLTMDLIKQADPSRFVIGISENVPPDRKHAVYSKIMDGIDEYWNGK